MFKTIVVGFDGSSRSEDALELGGVIARVSGARLIAACVYSYPFLYDDGDAVANEVREQASGVVAQAQRLADGSVTETVTIEGSSVAHGLEQVADEHDAQLIVVGSSHRGALGRITPGSVPERLVHGARHVVATAPAGYVTGGEPPELHSIGLGFDGSNESRLAAGVAIDLARGSRARLRVIGVIDTYLARLVPGPVAAMPNPEYMNAVADRERVVIREFVDSLYDVDAVADARHGSPARSLVDLAEELDLLVLGAHAYGTVRRVIGGSVSTRVMRAVTCPLIVVPWGVSLSGSPAETGAARSRAAR
jgi:nucleotide-binding universal stress UspA family protein